MRLAWLALGLLAFILIPFFLFEAPFEQLSTYLTQLHISPWLISPVLAALLAADIFLPVPSSLVATAAGVSLGFLGGTLTNVLGMTAGCAMGYYSGRPAGRKLLAETEQRQLEALWQRYGDWALIIARAVPVLAEASVLFAGMLGVEKKRFFILTTAANLGIGALYAAVGAFAMQGNSFLAAFAGSLLIPAIAMGLLRARKL